MRELKSASLLAVVGLLAWPAGAMAGGPRLDCAAPAAGAAATVCASEALRKRDGELATKYEAILEIAEEEDRIKLELELVSWTGRRDACGTDATCLEAAYAEGERMLAAWTP